MKAVGLNGLCLSERDSACRRNDTHWGKKEQQRDLRCGGHRLFRVPCAIVAVLGSLTKFFLRRRVLESLSTQRVPCRSMVHTRTFKGCDAVALGLTYVL